MKTRQFINQIITALMELEAKGSHSVFFAYENGLFRVKILQGEVTEQNTVFEKTVDVVQELSELEWIFKYVENMKLLVHKTQFQCYRREFIQGVKTGEWEKIKPSFVLGENATCAMLLGGLGSFYNDPENNVQYYVDMTRESESEK